MRLVACRLAGSLYFAALLDTFLRWLPSSLKNISTGTNAENLGFFCKIARLVGIMRCGAVATSQCWTP